MDNAGHPKDVPGAARGAAIHRRFYLTSVFRTLGFYGTVLVICLTFHVFVALAIAVFFLFFYKREIRTFLRHPLRKLGLASPAPGSTSAYRMAVIPPGVKSRFRSTPPTGPSPPPPGGNRE
jgi:hypothetical protein